MTQEEFLRLYDIHRNTVYRLALAMLKSVPDAQDVVQNVFVKLLDARIAPQPGKERQWLIKVTVNACRDVMRSAWWRNQEPLDENIPFSQPEESAVFHAVMTLPEKYRLVIHLHYYEGYTCSEIGNLMKISPSAVSMRLSRARNMLKSRLEDEDERLVSKDL